MSFGICFDLAFTKPMSVSLAPWSTCQWVRWDVVRSLFCFFWFFLIICLMFLIFFLLFLILFILFLILYVDCLLICFWFFLKLFCYCSYFLCFVVPVFLFFASFCFEFVLECVDCFSQLFFDIILIFWERFRFSFARIATFRSSPLTSIPVLFNDSE